jgi:hypothetical protein
VTKGLEKYGEQRAMAATDKIPSLTLAEQISFVKDVSVDLQGPFIVIDAVDEISGIEDHGDVRDTS